MPAFPSPSPDTDDLPIGSVLDERYRIDAILGTGGMGRVYRGEHVGIGKRVAIKVLHADLSRNREAAQRFQREAIASGRLDHANIVGVSDFGIVDDGPCYLVMEILDGESLGARLEREKRVPWREALEILRGVLLGLQHAHERGVVHRDIKPDNVFLSTKDGETVVKILDFGIAKLYAGSPDDPASTRAGLTVGTPAYLSPEQAVGGEILPASDLYSTTILLFEMIAGRPPFEDKDPLAMLGAHVSRTPPTIAEVAPELAVPQALEELIQRGLVKAQADRITSAHDYLELLDAVVASDAPASVPAVASEGAALGFAPTHTAMPMIATPPPGTILPGPATPVPFAPIAGAAPTVGLPTVTRAVSLADTPPIPKNWIKVGAIVVGAVIVLSIIVAIATRGETPTPAPERGAVIAPPKVEDADKKTVTRPAAKKPVKDDSPAPRPPIDKPLIKPDKTDRDVQLKAALHDLTDGKQCSERRAAIPKLVALGDKTAIPALKRARYRGRGGLLGLGERNTNACLRKDAETAIRALGGTVK